MAQKYSKAEQEQLDLIIKFGQMAKEAGCCKEQVENFLMAGVTMQKKQLEIAALCRQCDLPNGPKKILAGGGRGSGKSTTILTQIFCDDCQRIKGLKVLALRKVGRANKEQIADFRKKLLFNLPHTYREQAQTIDFANGSQVILGNFKDEKDIDKYLGLEYDLIYIMECNQLSASKITNIMSCLRTNKTDWRPRAYMDTNPGGISHIEHKKEFVDPWKNGTEKDTRYIHSTVDDNKFVNPEYKAFLQTLVGWQRMAWLEGSWEFMAGSFFSNFYDTVHVYPNETVDLDVKKCPTVRWFAGLDYGFSHPTAFTLCCEDESGRVFITDSYGEPNTTIEQHAANIKDILALRGLIPEDLEFIAAGKDCFRVDKDGGTVATEYMERGLMLTAVHIDRVNAWAQMAEMFGDIQKQIQPRLFIHKNCTELIQQIQMAQCDEKKPNDIQKINFDSENQNGGDDQLESCFVAGTMVLTELGETPIEKIKVGDKVWTRKGLRKVLSAGSTGVKKTRQLLFDNGKSLIGTCNHPIWQYKKGWTRLDSLRNGDKVSICLNYLKPSYSTAENSAAIQTRLAHTCVNTISQVKSSLLGKASRFTKKFTSIITDFQKSLKDATYTTKTKTRLTTTFPISKCLQQSSTEKNTPMTLEGLPKSIWLILHQLESSPLNGITPKKRENFQSEIIQLRSEKASQIKNLSVNTAERILKSTLRITQSNSAMSIARSRSNDETSGTGLIKIAKFADKHSRHTNTQKPKLAHANVVENYEGRIEKVFNLEVEDCHEYFANGVLVHNCRNSLVMAYTNLLSTAKPIKMGNFQSISEKVTPDYIDVEAELIEAEQSQYLIQDARTFRL